MKISVFIWRYPQIYLRISSCVCVCVWTSNQNFWCQIKIYRQIQVVGTHFIFICDFQLVLVHYFCVLPFRLNTACTVSFTHIAEVLVANTRKHCSLHVHLYLDDWLFHHLDSETLLRFMLDLLDFIHSLGWEVNLNNSSLSEPEVQVSGPSLPEGFRSDSPSWPFNSQVLAYGDWDLCPVSGNP